jgi:hypothetical protein
MPCAGCLEKRGRVLRAIGLGRFAPKVPSSGPFAPVAHVQAELAITEFDAPPLIKNLFGRFLWAAANSTVKDITFAAAHLIVFALGNACAELKCAEEQIEAVHEMINRRVREKYDKDTGKRREIVLAKAYNGD